ncbi:MAG TPA: 6-hydroxymethylpterin diphosphokinase MptE-like protein [Nitrosopumilaceae archaeon]|nr:6-hydroxymethylpterin diphosphokinase MptE-like protein [Nitrosopumilaceae archaeon]
MSKDFEFSINENTLVKMLSLKKEAGFENKGWDEWFDHVFASDSNTKSTQDEIEKTMEKLHYESFDDWVQNFSINLNNIWIESSARELDPTKDPNYKKEERSAIVIGRGPSIKKHNHLELLANSDYKGSIVCCDGALINALSAGVTPEKFQKFYVVTIDPYDLVKQFYDHKIVDKYGSKIKGIFSTVVKPTTVERARHAGIKIHWLHPLIDNKEGRKSFNQIAALMVRAKNHPHGLPAIQTGGNVGTSSWFVSWQILKCSTVALIGINHGWNEDDPWEQIISHGRSKLTISVDKNSPAFQQLFPKIYNPEFDCTCILDPLFQFYSSALKEFILRSPSWVNTVNATEGGSIFGKRILCMTLAKFIGKFHV